MLKVCFSVSVQKLKFAAFHLSLDEIGHSFTLEFSKSLQLKGVMLAILLLQSWPGVLLCRGEASQCFFNFF